MSTPSRQRGKPFGQSQKSILDSLSDIQKVLTKFGASKFGFAFEEGQIQVGFEHEGLMYQFLVSLPSGDELEAQRLWRVFYNSIKADLIAVTEGVVRLQERFQANIVDPQTGQTYAQMLRPQIEQARRKGLPK